MTLFAGALLRTIEFVMVTTDASFLGPRERAAAAGSWAAEQMMRTEARALAAGSRPTRIRNPRDAVRPQPAGERPAARPSWTEVLADTHRSSLEPQCRIGMVVHKLPAC